MKGRRHRMGLHQFKQALGEDDREKLEAPLEHLPSQVEDCVPFLAALELPINYAEAGHRFKKTYSRRISSVFTSMEKLILFMNIRPEIPYEDIARDENILIRTGVRAEASTQSTKPVRRGFFGRIFGWFFGR